VQRKEYDWPVIGKGALDILRDYWEGDASLRYRTARFSSAYVYR